MGDLLTERIAAAFGRRQVEIVGRMDSLTRSINQQTQAATNAITTLAKPSGPWEAERGGQIADRWLKLLDDITKTISMHLERTADETYRSAADAITGELTGDELTWLLVGKLTQRTEESLVEQEIFRFTRADAEKLRKSLPKKSREEFDKAAEEQGLDSVTLALQMLIAVPRGVPDDYTKALVVARIRADRGRVPPGVVAEMGAYGRHQGSIAVGAPESLADWWEMGFHLLDPDEKRAVLREYVFPAPSAAKIDSWLSKPMNVYGESMTWEERLLKTSKLIADPSRLSASIASVIAAGGQRQDVLNAVLPQVQRYRVSAVRIARMEIARVASEANQAVYDDAGDIVAGQQINAVLDTATRPEHATRNGRIWWKRDAADYATLPSLPDDYNCVLPGQGVRGNVLVGIKAFYDGEAVECRSRSGATLRITAHHPVLTARGWVPANMLQKGDHLLRYVPRVDFPADDEENCPITIEQVFSAVAEVSAARCRVRPTAHHLHGDAARVVGEVEIVRADGKLRRELGLIDEAGDHSLPSGLSAEVGGSRRRSLSQFVGRDGSSASRLPSLPALAANETIVPLHVRPFEPFRVGLSSHRAASVEQLPIKPEWATESVLGAASGDAGFGRQFLEGFSSLVASDEIVEVKVFRYSGHVFDLQTTTGWYFANNLLISNCRCYLSPVLRPPDDLASNPQLAKAFESNAGPVLDPIGYSDWFRRASEQERRVVVGSRRYDAVKAKLSAGESPEFGHFVDEQGQLLPVATIKAESKTTLFARHAENAKKFEQFDKDLQQIRQKSFLAPTRGGR